MPIDRFEVTNHERWGNLVKTWALGEDRINDGNNYLPLPENLARFTEMLQLAQVGAHIPAYVTDLKFVSAPKEILLIRLPPADLIKDSEANFQSGGSYQLPDFYNLIFHSEPDVPTLAAKMSLHAKRIGDYTMRVCV